MANSSTKKAAKLAQRGGGTTVRFQGGTVFPLAVALTVILGLALVVYARQSVPSADASRPQLEDSWDAAYGFNICGEWFELNGDLDALAAEGQDVDLDMLRTGDYSDNDGIIHWHPDGSPAIGRDARLKVFLDAYGVEVTNDELRVPAAQVATVPGLEAEYVEGEFECDGDDVEVTVRAWDSFTDTDAGDRYISNMGNIRINEDAMVFAINVLPNDADQPMPPSAQELVVATSGEAVQVSPDETTGDETTGDETSDEPDSDDG